MKIYLAMAGGSAKNIRDRWGCGWLITPENHRKLDPPYVVDNGAFSAFKNQTPYSPSRFYQLLERYPDYDFCIIPDIVCGGMKSLSYSLDCLDSKTIPRGYLAVQDGMKINDVNFVLQNRSQDISGIFVGGSIPWKYSTAGAWAKTAHNYGLKCHVGRVGSYEGYLQMHYAGVDSVDSTTAVRHRSDIHIKKYHDHLNFQMKLLDASPEDQITCIEHEIAQLGGSIP